MTQAQAGRYGFAYQALRLRPAAFVACPDSGKRLATLAVRRVAPSRKAAAQGSNSGSNSGAVPWLLKGPTCPRAHPVREPFHQTNQGVSSVWADPLLIVCGG
jgi:hypothetical protein